MIDKFVSQVQVVILPVYPLISGGGDTDVYLAMVRTGEQWEV